MAHELPPLPYDLASLEPHIDAQTLGIHHGKHHQTYVNNLNAALEGHPELQAKSVEQLLAEIADVPETIRQAVINNGGGHANHSLFWESMAPGGGGVPVGDLAKSITRAFGSFDAFKEQLARAGMTRFGSGWAWLSVDAGGKLQITSTPNAETPLMKGETPILVLDVWEHAYYLKYQNRRADFIAAWWNLVNWEAVAARFATAGGGCRCCCC